MTVSNNNLPPGFWIGLLMLAVLLYFVKCGVFK